MSLKPSPRACLLVLLVLALAAVSGRGACGRKPLPTFTPNLKIMRSAHRGVSRLAAENTLPGLEMAIKMGYDYIEVDVGYSRDGVPVLMHDDSVDRTTNGKGPVSSFTLAELKRLNAGRVKGHRFPPTPIPTLEEALALMQGKTKLYIDQKAPAQPELIRLLKKYGFYPDRVVIWMQPESAPPILRLDPHAPVMPRLKRAPQIEPFLQRYPSAVAFDISCADLTPEMVLAAHRHGIMVFSDAVDTTSPKCMRRPIAYGADVIQIDNFDLLNELIERIKNLGPDAETSAPEAQE
jgi:glycerophosphoryl diester phosphodiesterase